MKQPIAVEGVAVFKITRLGAICLLIRLGQETGAVPNDLSLRQLEMGRVTFFLNHPLCSAFLQQPKEMRRLRELHRPPRVHFSPSVLGADVLTAHHSAGTKRLAKREGHPALVPLLAGVLAAGI